MECETNPRRSDVKDRIERLHTAEPAAKYVLAVPDYLGYEAGGFERLTEVWVVCRDGRVLKPKEWVEWRKNYLLEAVNVEKLAVLLRSYRHGCELHSRWLSLRERLLLRLSGYVSAVAASVLGDPSWLEGQPINWRLNYMTEFRESLLREIRVELLADIVELTNRVMALSTPYRLRLNDDGVLTAESDLDAMDWLGESDAPAPAENARKYAKHLKTMLTEMQMLSDVVKPKIEGLLQNMEYPIHELLEIGRASPTIKFL